VFVAVVLVLLVPFRTQLMTESLRLAGLLSQLPQVGALGLPCAQHVTNCRLQRVPCMVPAKVPRHEACHMTLSVMSCILKGTNRTSTTATNTICPHVAATWVPPSSQFSMVLQAGCAARIKCV
jgi:hypothetical protein